MTCRGRCNRQAKGKVVSKNNILEGGFKPVYLDLAPECAAIVGKGYMDGVKVGKWDQTEERRRICTDLFRQLLMNKGSNHRQDCGVFSTEPNIDCQALGEPQCGNPVLCKRPEALGVNNTNIADFVGSNAHGALGREVHELAIYEVQLPEDGIEVSYVGTPRWYLEKSESDPALQSHAERDCAENT
ncbi:hypothetical protein K438DRAFT_1769205 [Mycena galopus ATCC 62051]|nr:hypothetical protein K438DRAFT_1769205 [Mycena galopus ATCC 62051]